MRDDVISRSGFTAPTYLTRRQGLSHKTSGLRAQTEADHVNLGQGNGPLRVQPAHDPGQVGPDDLGVSHCRHVPR